MDKPSITNATIRSVLVALSLCAALIGGALFVHARHMIGRRASESAHILPGITLVDAEPGGGGLIVTSMQSGGEAGRLGIAVGDDIVRIDGAPIGSLDQARAYLLQHPRPRIVLGLKHQDAMRMVTLDRSDPAP